MYKMSTEEFRKVLQIGTVDTENSGLFGASTLVEVDKSRLTLVIGIGGSGITALEKTADLVRSKMQTGYSQYVKFLAVDSASNELAELRGKGKGITTLDISFPGFQGRLQNMRSEFFKKFVPEDFQEYVIDHLGAGANRMVGRAKLYDTNHRATSDQELHDLIRGFFWGDWAGTLDMPIDILILTGLCGGTGSGTFIDIAAIAKDACPDPNKVTVYGFLMLPDEEERFAHMNNISQLHYANAFAALKELERYESIGMELEKQKERIHTNFNDIPLSVLNKPLDYPILISGYEDEAVSSIAHSIIQFIAYNKIGSPIRIVLANSFVERDRKNYYMKENGILRMGKYPEDSHMYAGIGSARTTIPEKHITSHLIGAVSKKLFCAGKTLSKEEFEKAMRSILSLNPNEILREDSLWRHISRELISHCQVNLNPVELTYDEIAFGQVDLYLQAFRVDQSINKALDHMIPYVKEEVLAIEERTRNLMKQYGPRGILELWDGNELALNAQIRRVAVELENLSKITGNMPAFLPPLSPIQKLLRGKKDVYEWCDAARYAKMTDVRSIVCKHMSGTDGVWEHAFVTPLNEFIESTERFKEVLESLAEFYSEAGRCLDSYDFREFARGTGEFHAINICSNAEPFEWVKRQIKEKLEKIDIQRVQDELVDSFYVRANDWISNAEGKSRGIYDEVMSRTCEIGRYSDGNMKLGIKDYFENILMNVPEENQQQVADMAVEAFLSRLIEESSPSLKMNPYAEKAVYRDIILPDTLEKGRIGSVVRNAINTALGYLADTTMVSYSSAVDSIECYSTSIANALCNLKDLDLWEDCYDHLYSSTMHRENGEVPSMHITEGHSQYTELDQEKTAEELGEEPVHEILPKYAGTSLESEIGKIYGSGISWQHHPSINLCRYGHVFSERKDTEESRYRDLFLKRVDEALRIGLIEWEQDKNCYKCYLNVIPNDWKNLDVSGYRCIKKGAYERGRELFEYLKKQNPAGSPDYRKQIALSHLSFFGPQGYDFTDVINTKHWKEEQIAQTKHDYMLRTLRKSIGLYQDMLDSMYRFYDIELELEKKELELQKTRDWKCFINWLMNGVVETDRERKQWNILTTFSGHSEHIITFDGPCLVKVSDLDRVLLDSGLRIMPALHACKEKQAKLGVSNEYLDELGYKILDTMTEESYDKFLTTRLEIFEEERSIYTNIIGKSKDHEDAIMRYFGMDDDRLAEAEQIVDFYEMLSDIIDEMK